MNLKRVGNAYYDEPVRDDSGTVYATGTWIVAVYEDDGDRYVTKASAAVRAAWGIE
jgi:hypothetical protein